MLISCPECGTQVSDVAETCPKCAYPIAKKAKEKKLRLTKFFGLLATASFFVILAGAYLNKPQLLPIGFGAGFCFIILGMISEALS